MRAILLILAVVAILACDKGYYPDSRANGKCYQCSHVCITCDKVYNNCTQCRKGFLVGQNGACLPQCTFDQTVYNVALDRCEDFCKDGCGNCLIGDRNYCVSCTEGYHLQGYNCISWVNYMIIGMSVLMGVFVFVLAGFAINAATFRKQALAQLDGRESKQSLLTNQ